MRRQPIILVSIALAAVLAAAPASAKWGCGARSVRGISASWSANTREDAIEAVMASCRQSHVECKLIGCSPDVDTEAQVDAHWPPAAPGVKYEYCGTPGRPACK